MSASRETWPSKLQIALSRRAGCGDEVETSGFIFFFKRQAAGSTRGCNTAQVRLVFSGFDGAAFGCASLGRPTFATPFLAQQFCVSPLADQKRDRFFVGRYELFPTQPVTLKGNHAVSKITTRFQHRQACIHGRSVDLHGGDRDQRAYCCGCVLRGEFVYAQQQPHELAQARQVDSDQFGAAQKLDCRAGLLSIVCDDRTNQHVRVNRELLFLPAQAFAMASLARASNYESSK